MVEKPSELKNAHLEGDAFYWEGGPVGVLLSHGFTATSAEVRLLARHLHARGFSVAGPLLPGHATSIEDLNRCRWQDWVRGVEQTYQQLVTRCQKVVVGGESLGSLLALYLASEHPQAAAVLAYAPALHSTSWALNFLPISSHLLFLTASQPRNRNLWLTSAGKDIPSSRLRLPPSFFAFKRRYAGGCLASTSLRW